MWWHRNMHESAKYTLQLNSLVVRGKIRHLLIWQGICQGNTMWVYCHQLLRKTPYGLLIERKPFTTYFRVHKVLDYIFIGLASLIKISIQSDFLNLSPCKKTNVWTILSPLYLVPLSYTMCALLFFTLICDTGLICSFATEHI